MTKSKKALIAGAALAGLLAGTTSTIQASNLLSGMRLPCNPIGPVRQEGEGKARLQGSELLQGQGRM